MNDEILNIIFDEIKLCKSQINILQKNIDDLKNEQQLLKRCTCFCKKKTNCEKETSTLFQDRVRRSTVDIVRYKDICGVRFVYKGNRFVGTSYTGQATEQMKKILKNTNTMSLHHDHSIEWGCNS